MHLDHHSLSRIRYYRSFLKNFDGSKFDYSHLNVFETVYETSKSMFAEGPQIALPPSIQERGFLRLVILSNQEKSFFTGQFFNLPEHIKTRVAQSKSEACRRWSKLTNHNNETESTTILSPTSNQVRVHFGYNSR